MRLTILSDIHGNLEALGAVLEDARNLQALPPDTTRLFGLADPADPSPTSARAARADAAGPVPSALVCLGDMVGYGADPEAVVSVLRAQGVQAVMGNHEMGLKGGRMKGRFNPQAWESVCWTASRLSSENLRWLRDLPASLSLMGCRFVHGMPPDKVDAYLNWVSRDLIRQAMLELPEKVCFVGHTHLLGLASLQGDELKRSSLEEGERLLPLDARHLVNAGSVGQPRDLDPRAKYCLFDTASRELTVRFVPYDAEAAARKILELGQPKVFAERLLRSG